MPPTTRPRFPSTTHPPHSGDRRRRPFRVEKDTRRPRRELRLRQQFRQVVDEVRTPGRANAAQLLRERQLEEHPAAPHADSAGVEKAVPLQPVHRRRVQIVFRPQVGVARFMADNTDIKTIFHRPAEEVEGAGEGRRLRHAGPVDRPLHRRPGLLAADAAQVVAHAALVRRQRLRDQPLFPRHAMEKAVIADDRVVEIHADAHSDPHAFTISTSGRPTMPFSRASNAPLISSSGKGLDRIGARLSLPVSIILE